MVPDFAPRVFVIAEAGVNHNGSVELGEKLIDAAQAAGADAVKFQSFRAASLVARGAARAAYQVRNQPGEQSQLDMLRKLELDDAAQRRLCAHARKRGIEFMSTPFDLESLEFLVRELKVARLKIASGEITNAPLLLRAARSGLPLIVSTGMSTLDEVAQALRAIAYGAARPEGGESARAFAEVGEQAIRGLAGRVTLLQCTSDYPAPIADMNLRAMQTLRERFGLAAGLSDHSLGITAAIAAAALGAAVIEKHFTLDRALDGPDHRASLEPAELRRMIESVRDACAALGAGAKTPSEPERATSAIARRSLVAARRIRKGERLAAADIAVKRPAGGVSPMYYWDWIGRTAERDYEEDDPL
ncbi:MAG TPA: N-acetylneuraminate synthase [Burkholderiales bacterium]|nr:N-acetylneuraminate synthase [Burkholderiales bacterium]